VSASRRGAIVCALAALAVVSPACASDDPGPKPVRTADAYVAAIRWYVDSIPVPTSTATSDAVDQSAALVYIAPADGNPIDADAQVAVVEALSDMTDVVTVVFADVRDDAIDLEAENQPVKEGGALLLVGKVEEGPPPVEVGIEVYHDVQRDESFQMRIVRAGSDDYSVTAVTQLEQN
jgi:hypothetical protein